MRGAIDKCRMHALMATFHEVQPFRALQFRKTTVDYSSYLTNKIQMLHWLSVCVYFILLCVCPFDCTSLNFCFPLPFPTSSLQDTLFVAVYDVNGECALRNILRSEYFISEYSDCYVFALCQSCGEIFHHTGCTFWALCF